MHHLFLMLIFLTNFPILPLFATSVDERSYSQNLPNRFPSKPVHSSGSSPVSSPSTTNSSDSKVSFGCDAVEKSLVHKFDTNSIENIYLRPTATSIATTVKVAIDVKNIWIRESDNQWKMMLDLFQFWTDPRLAYNTDGCSAIQKFSLPNTDHIWKPDLFFPLAEEGFAHAVPQTNFHLWVKPNGEVTYGQRLTLIMECTGKGSRSGELMCPLIISSYRNPKDKLNIQWVSQNPVEIYWDRLTLKDYQIENVTVVETAHTVRDTTFAYIVGNFKFAKSQCMEKPGKSY